MGEERQESEAEERKAGDGRQEKVRQKEKNAGERKTGG
jgi:hypothetical protein